MENYPRRNKTRAKSDSERSEHSADRCDSDEALLTQSVDEGR